MGILFTILLGIPLTTTMGFLFTITLGIQFTVSKRRHLFVSLLAYYVELFLAYSASSLTLPLLFPICRA
jgi:hypothetical protein